jgi:hypothetical protein
MSALKIVQLIEAVIPPNNGISTSNPISLQTGLLRFSARGGDAHVVVLEDGVAGVANSETSFLVARYESEILKYNAPRQKISGITTGATTVIDFGSNSGNSFSVGDRVSIEGSIEPVGLGTTITHVEVLDIEQNSITVDADTTWVGIVTLSSNVLAKSVKFEVYGENNNIQVHCTEVQIVSG